MTGRSLKTLEVIHEFCIVKLQFHNVEGEAYVLKNVIDFAIQRQTMRMDGFLKKQ